MSTKHFCDSCDKEIEEANVKSLWVGRKTNVTILWEDRTIEEDICSSCESKIIDFLDSLSN